MASGQEKDAATVPQQGVELLFPAGTGKQAKGAKLSKKQKKAAFLLQKLKAIEEGGDINAVDKLGQTALMHAAAQDNRLAVCWLVAKGADATIRNKKGKTAAELAKDKQIQEFLTVISRMNEPLNEEEKEISVRFFTKENEGAMASPTNFRPSRSASLWPCTLTELGVLLRNPQVKIESDSWWTSDSDALKELTPEIMATYLQRGALDISSKDVKGESVWISQELNPAPITLACSLGISPPQSPEKKLLVAFASNNTALVEQLIKEAPTLINSPFVRQRGKLKDPLPLLFFASSKKMIDLLYKLGINDSDKVTDEEGKIHAHRRELVIQELIKRVPTENMDDVLSCLKEHGWQLPDGCLHHIIGVGGYRAALTESEREKKALSFIKAGANPNARDVGGRTPLFWAEDPQVVSALIQAGADVNAKDNGGETPLFRARNPAIVSALIQAGADVNAKNDKDETPLFRASILNRPSVVLALVQAGADVNARDYSGGTPLFRAEDPAVVSALIQAGADVNAKNNKGNTPLFPPFLIIENRPAIVPVLVQAGANVNARNDNGDTPLFRAEDPAIVSTLIQAGADVNAKNNKGETPLFGANEPAVASALIQAGADVNARNDNGETPLFRALEPTVVSALIQAGADVNAKNNAGKTVIQYEKQRKSREHDKIVKLLKEHGAKEEKSDLPNDKKSDSNAKDKEGRTLLMQAALDPDGLSRLKECIARKEDVNARDNKGCTALRLLFGQDGDINSRVQELLNAKADVNLGDFTDFTPLMTAACYKDAAKRRFRVQRLINARANVNAAGKAGNTAAMHLLLHYDDPDTLRMLLDAGAKPDHKNGEGKTMLDIASENHRNACIKLLNERFPASSPGHK